MTRDFGDIGRNGQPELRLEAGNAAVWDGRFVFKAMTDCIVRPSGAVRSALSDADRATLMKFPAALRTVVPTVDSSEGPVLALPEGHGHCETVRIACLVLPRFKAATGAVTRESDLATDV
ncbi:MAG: hypothetical protein JF571_05585 [Asticcacaulis sp.]|nr:hypothetical protein [Asticcacaulis sp.]